MVGCLSGFADCLFADVVLVWVCGGWFGFVLLLVWILECGVFGLLLYCCVYAGCCGLFGAWLRDVCWVCFAEFVLLWLLCWVGWFC